LTDYWRRSDENDEIFSCNGVSNGCEGGIHTGDASCSTGYEGVLCGSCSKGNSKYIFQSIIIIQSCIAVYLICYERIFFIEPKVP